jgi:hypothetical protein
MYAAFIILNKVRSVPHFSNHVRALPLNFKYPPFLTFKSFYAAFLVFISYTFQFKNSTAALGIYHLQFTYRQFHISKTCRAAYLIFKLYI